MFSLRDKWTGSYRYASPISKPKDKSFQYSKFFITKLYECITCIGMLKLVIGFSLLEKKPVTNEYLK
jgi:hypothetical protein